MLPGMTSLRRVWFLAVVLSAAGLAWGAVPRGTDAASLTAEEQAQGYRNGRVLVRLREGIAMDPDAGRMSAETRAGVGTRHAFSHLRRQQLLEFDRTRSVQAVITELRASGLYEFVEPDRIVHALAAPNDPSFAGLQWAL